MEADIGAHGFSSITTKDSAVHLATRISVLYGLHRYFALGLQLAFSLDRNTWSEAQKTLNRNLYTGVDLRLRFPYRRLSFWAALTTGYARRHYLREGDRWKDTDAMGIGAGIGIDCFITPSLAIGASSWVLRELLMRGAPIHWTVTAGVRIYLSRRAP